MNNFFPTRAVRARADQSGAALIVVLMLLIIVTLLGLAALRGAIMQERMAASTTARSMAFQVAEAGLRQGEIIARDATLTFPASGCAAGRCAMPAPNSTPDWTANNFWSSGAGFQTGTAISTSAGNLTPKFVIENFGQTAAGVGSSNCIDASKPCIQSVVQNVYRVTAYASTPNGAEVILQSMYKR